MESYTSPDDWLLTHHAHDAELTPPIPPYYQPGLNDRSASISSLFSSAPQYPLDLQLHVGGLQSVDTLFGSTSTTPTSTSSSDSVRPSTTTRRTHSSSSSSSQSSSTDARKAARHYKGTRPETQAGTATQTGTHTSSSHRRHRFRKSSSSSRST